jgi:hypothetical protein
MKNMIRIYKIPPAKKSEIKNALEFQDFIKDDKLVINEFARNGYDFRDAAGLGFAEDVSYVYVDGGEGFFNENEKTLMLDGVVKLSGADYDRVKKAFDDQAESAAAGVGAIFDGF